MDPRGVCSQTISILSPTSGTEITPGQDVTVQLGFANSLTGVEHVSAVIAMINCAGAPCPSDASDTLGIPLFAGNYTPELHEGNLVSLISCFVRHSLDLLIMGRFFIQPPYQNFVRTNSCLFTSLQAVANALPLNSPKLSDGYCP
ncbi:hypothetical protein EV361DRAFT_881443 [Lentinula raphanica]|nr:hypothetical protein EV361DRAFT_881443 [Lentinula raphanica]